MPDASKDLKILEQLRNPALASEVVGATGLPRATLYRRLKELELQGLIYKTGEAYQLEAMGLHALQTKKMPLIDRPILRQWTWLHELPLPTFRALASLVIFAVVARRANLGEDRNPGFIALGPTQRLKSWLAKCLCFLAGSTPDKCRQPMQSIRQRGLIGRLDGRGGLSYTNVVLQEPIIWLEELSLAEPGVYRDITALLQGNRLVKIENQEVDIPAVPFLELNPLVPDGDLAQRTGMDIPRLRRTIPVDFAHCEVTDGMRGAAAQILDKISAMGPLLLNEPPREPLSVQANEEMNRLIAAVLNPDFRDYVDPGRLATLVLGARAVLPEREAVHEVILSWAECVTTVGFLKPRWRGVMASLLNMPEEKTSGGVERKTDLAPPAPVQSSMSNAPAAAESQAMKPCNPYLLDDVLLNLNFLIKETGLSIPEDHEAIAGVLKLVASLKKEKLPFRSFTRDSQYWVRMVKSVTFFNDAKVSSQQMEYLRAGLEMLSAKVHPLPVDVLAVRIFTLIQQLGFTPHDAAIWTASMMWNRSARGTENSDDPGYYTLKTNIDNKTYQIHVSLTEVEE